MFGNIVNLLIFKILLDFGECALSWEVFHFKNKTVWEEADGICKANGYVLAVVDSQEKWDKVVYNITGGNRYTADADVYIGLIYTPSINNFTWVNGVRASWTKWFTNEPYYTETRHCVRLDVYAEYQFRTTDCSYKHHFVCAKEESATMAPTTDDTNSSMIVGMCIGFGVFLFIGFLICLMCKCCCQFQENKLLPSPKKMKLPTRSNPNAKQYQINMNQVEGVNYNRLRSSASNQMPRSRTEYSDDVYDDDHHHGPVIGVEPYNSRLTSRSLNDSSSPSTIKSEEYLHFM